MKWEFLSFNTVWFQEWTFSHHKFPLWQWWSLSVQILLDSSDQILLTTLSGLGISSGYHSRDRFFLIIASLCVFSLALLSSLTTQKPYILSSHVSDICLDKWKTSLPLSQTVLLFWASSNINKILCDCSKKVNGSSSQPTVLYVSAFVLSMSSFLCSHLSSLLTSSDDPKSLTNVLLAGKNTSYHRYLHWLPVAAKSVSELWSIQQHLTTSTLLSRSTKPFFHCAQSVRA